MPQHRQPIRRAPWTHLVGLLCALALPQSGTAQDVVHATGPVGGWDLVQGSGTAIHADGWEAIRHALAGSGNQAAHVDGAAQTGPGSMQASHVAAAGWRDMARANAGTGFQLSDSLHANGGDRVSRDSIVHVIGASEVTHTELRSAVAQSSVRVEAPHAQSNTSIALSGESFSSGFYGVHAIAFQAGANASQNVSVNVVGGAVGATPPAP